MASNESRLKLADIASRAGVSTATVDRVIHNRSGVKPHTVSHIRAIIREMEAIPATTPGNGRNRGQNKFTVILPKGTNSFFNTLEAEIDAISKAQRNVQINVERIEGFNPQLLARCIRQQHQSSDGIALVAIEDPVVREAVNDAVDAGVPVVTLVSDLSNARHQAYIGLDNRAAGRTAGYLMGRLLPEKGSVLLIAGSISLRDHEEREIGFRRVLGELNDKIRIIAHLEDHDDYHTTYDETMSVISSTPDLAGIYNIGAGNRGIALALEERGKQKDIVFIGHELTRFSRRYLIDGTMDAVIDQDPRGEARQLTKVLLDLSSSNPFSADTTPREVRIYLRENLP